MFFLSSEATTVDQKVGPVSFHRGHDFHFGLRFYASTQGKRFDNYQASLFHLKYYLKNLSSRLVMN